MVLHNTQAQLNQAYEDAHASDEFKDEDEPVVECSFTCVYCEGPVLLVDGEWICEGMC